MASIIEPFRVLPWDFFPDKNAAPPHLEAIQISGAPRVFELLKRGSRVYFRQHGDVSRVWTTLDDSDDTDMARTFRRAIGSGRIGRMFEHQRDGIGYEPHCYFSLLMSARGEVQGREWCLTDWFDLRPDSPKLRRYLADNSRLGVFHPKWKPPFREVLQKGFGLFGEQPFDQTQRALTMRWLGGDEGTLKQIVAPFLWHNFAAATPAATPLYARFIGRHRGLDKRPIAAGAPRGIQPKVDIFPQLFKHLLERHFQVTGVSWTTNFNAEDANRRSAWHLNVGEYEVQVSSTPTAHERLEAHLCLRDWLADKLAPAQVEDILNSLRP